MFSSENDQFLILKDCCVKCANNATVRDLRQLRQHIQTMDGLLLSMVANYVLFPLKLMISKFAKQERLSEKLTIETLSCIETLYSKTSIDSFDVFADIFISLNHFIDHRANANKFISEDVKKHTVTAVNVLILSLTPINCGKLCDSEFRPVLGHSISILLHLAVVEKYKDLKRASLRTLLNLIKRSVDCSDETSNCDPRDVFASFLPGISISLTKILTEDDKVNRDLLTLSLKCFDLILTLTLSEKSDFKVECNNGEQFIVERNEEWFENCSSKLVGALRKVVFTLISHSSKEVREELLIFGKDILLKCSPKFLGSSADIFLDILLSMLSDEEDQLRKVANEAMESFSNSVLSSSRTLTDLIFEQIFKFITSFPREMRAYDEQRLTAQINILNGYITCLGSSGITQVMSMDLYRQRLFRCLCELCEFDYNNIGRFYNFVNPVNDHGAVDVDLQLDVRSKRFKHFIEPKTERCLQRSCSNLGALCDENAILDYLLDTSRSAAGNASTFYVINCILRGMRKTHLIVQIVEEYLSLLRFPQSSEELTKITANTRRLMVTCQLLEGISVLASLCCDEYKYRFINKVLCVLIAYSGFENHLIAQTSINSLREIANAFNYSSINHLVSANMNYLISCVTLKLRRLEDVEEANAIIRKVLALSTIENLKYFVRTVDELLSTLDASHRCGNKHLFKIVHTFVKVICNLNSSSPIVDGVGETSTKLSENDSRMKKINDFRDEIDAYLRNKRIAECLHVEDEDSRETNEEEVKVGESEEEVNAKRIPVYASMIVKILERCKHIISHPDVEIRLMVLDCIACGMRALRDFEGILARCLLNFSLFYFEIVFHIFHSKNADESLPMAHQLWQPLVIRFKDKEVAVMKMAFTCLLAMAETCKDFVRSRTLKDVLPSLTYFLKRQAKESFKKDTPAYRFTANYKFQLQLLDGFGLLSWHLALCEQQLWHLIDATSPYLSGLQPRQLQASAVNAFAFYVRIDPCAVWYYLKQIYHRVDDTHPHFEVITIDSWQREDCSRNVNALLQHCFS